MKFPFPALVVSLAFPILTAVVACGSSTSSTPTADAGSDANTDAGQLDSATDAGADLFAADTRKLVVTSKDGFVAGPPDGSSCPPIDTSSIAASFAISEG